MSAIMIQMQQRQAEATVSAGRKATREPRPKLTTATERNIAM